MRRIEWARRARAGTTVSVTLVVAIAGAGCSSSVDNDDVVPARDLSLAELAAGPPVEVQQVPAIVPAVDALDTIERRVAAGATSREAADVALLQALYGDASEIAAAAGSGDVSVAMPDVLGAHLALRAERSDSDAVRAQYQAIIDQAATGRSPVASLFSPRAAYAAQLTFPKVLVSSDRRIAVLVRDGVSDAAASSTLNAAVTHWPAISGFFSLAAGQTAAATGGLRIYNWVTLNQEVGGFPAGTVAHIALPMGNDRFELDIVREGQPAVKLEANGAALTKFDLVIEAKTAVANGAGMYTSCSARGTWAPSNNMPTIEVDATVDMCEIPGVVVHELFHCAHATYVGAQDKYEFAEVPFWAIEGAAAWAEDAFLPGANTEWYMHECYANPLANPAACGGPVGPQVPLSARRHTAAMYFVFMDQFRGGQGTVRSVLGTFQDNNTDLGSLPSNVGGEGWLDFVDASAGYDAFFENGSSRLTDLPDFPYASTAQCDGQTVEAGQENYAVRTEVGEFSGAEVHVQVAPMAAQHVILEIAAGADIDYIDVAFDDELAQRLMGGGNDGGAEARVKAALLSDWGDQVEDWGERWQSQESEAPDLIVDSIPSSGSIRLCLEDVGPCEGVEPIHRGLYEIRIAIGNAATAAGQDLRGSLVLIPTKLAGWEAERFRLGTPEDEQ